MGEQCNDLGDCDAQFERIAREDCAALQAIVSQGRLQDEFLAGAHECLGRFAESREQAAAIDEFRTAAVLYLRSGYYRQALQIGEKLCDSSLTNECDHAILALHQSTFGGSRITLGDGSLADEARERWRRAVRLIPLGRWLVVRSNRPTPIEEEDGFALLQVACALRRQARPEEAVELMNASVHFLIEHGFVESAAQFVELWGDIDWALNILEPNPWGSAELALRHKRFQRAVRDFERCRSYERAAKAAIAGGLTRSAVTNLMRCACPPCSSKAVAMAYSEGRRLIRTVDDWSWIIEFLETQGEYLKAGRLLRDRGDVDGAIDTLAKGPVRLAAKWAEHYCRFDRALELYARAYGVSDARLSELRKESADVQDRIHCVKVQANGYRVTRVISKLGSTGLVFLGFPGELSTPRAIKVIRDSNRVSPAEARVLDVLTALRLDHVVRVEQAGSQIALYDGEAAYTIVMEFVGGKLLEECMADGHLDDALVMSLGRQAFSAIKTLRDLGVTHRDLNKRNIKVDTDGRLVILDFGLATDQDQPQAKDNTRTGPPAHKPASDLFSLGMLMYEMSAGEHLLVPRHTTSDSQSHRRSVSRVKRHMYSGETLHEQLVRRIRSLRSSHIANIVLACIGTTHPDISQIEQLLSDPSTGTTR